MRIKFSFKKFCFPLFYLLLVFPIFSEDRYHISSFDSSKYPILTVELIARENLFGKEGELLISEDIGEGKKIATEYKLSENTEQNPLHVYLSIPSYANWEEKKWLLQFSHNIATLVERSKGKFFLNVQSDDKFIFYEGLPAIKLTPSFALPKESMPNYPLRTWEKVIGKMKADEHPNKVFISLSFQNDWEDKFRIADFAKKINEEKIRYFVAGHNSLETTKLASYVNGKFFSIASEEGISALFKELNALALPKVSLVYKSPLELSPWSYFEADVEISFGEEKNLTYRYEVSLIKTIYYKFIDPFIFYPVLFFFIILCFSVLYYLRGYEVTKSKYNKPKRSNEKISIISELSAENQRNKNELEVYERVYGEVTGKARENEIVSQFLEREEIYGETYAIAVLVIKEGVSQGEKYILKSDETLIGRGEDCDLVLNDPYVDIVHAKIKKVRGRQLLFDCASSEGVLLNGKKLLRPKALHDLDEVKIGKTVFSFRGR